MALTASEMIAKMKQERSLAINSKNAMQQTQVDKQEEDAYNNKYLHGDTNNIGINDLIWYYYKEKEYEKGTIFKYPELASSLSSLETTWETVLTNALSSSGDGINGFYPPNEDGAGDSVMNMESYYINENGDSEPTNGGLIGYVYTFQQYLGNPASGDSRTSGDSYDTPAEAQTAAKIWLYGDSTAPGTEHNTTYLGKGLRGRRTANVDIGTQVTGSSKYVYTIGKDGTTDDPTFYADNTVDENGFLGNIAYKTNFLDSLYDILLYGDSNSDFQVHLRNLKTEIYKIHQNGDSNPLFLDPDMQSDVGDTPGDIDTYLSDIHSYIGDSSDVVGDSTLYGFYNYFNSATGNESAFNDNLGALNLKAYNFRMLLQDRFEHLDTKGDSGDTGIIGRIYVTSEADITRLRKWRLFWIKTRIQKPKATNITDEGIITAIDEANKQISKANDILEVIFGTSLNDHLQFIPTPTIFSTYFDPKRDEDTGVITKRRVGIVYDGQIHAEKYWIYRKPLSNVSVSDGQWGDSAIHEKYGDTNTETGFIKNTYIDLDASFSPGDKYVYRVRTMDFTNTVNGDTTASLQSDLYNANVSKSFTQITNNIVKIGDSHEFSEGGYVAITGTTSVDGFYLITASGDTTITIDDGDSSVINDTSGGTVYASSSVIFIQE